MSCGRSRSSQVPILNYTTSIHVSKSVGEIQIMLAKAGANRISITYSELGIPVALEFFIDLAGTPVGFRLPSRWYGIYQLLKDNASIRKEYRSEDHARRVAWRILKDWTEAQLAIIEAELASSVEVFLPYAITRTGKTVYEDYLEGKLLLGGGEEHDKR